MEGKGLAVTIGNWAFTISPVWPQIAAYVVLFLFVLWMVWQLQKSSVTTANLFKFRQLLYSLALNKQYSLMASIIKDNVQRLVSIYNHRSLWHHMLESRNAKQDSGIPFPWHKKLTRSQEKVVSVFSQVMSDKELTEFLVGNDVSIPLFIVEGAVDKVYDFDIEDYLYFVLNLLISKPNSELYQEIKQHQNIDVTGKRDIKDSRILLFLFRDANAAKKWSVWKPIGEYALRYLHDRPGGIKDEYNLEANYYTDIQGTERFSDPVFVSLEYFDFMVREALIQCTKWHMWLYYLRYWIEEIVGKLSYNEDEWQKGNWEYPTKYAYILYKIIHYQLGWFDFALRNSLDIKVEQLAPHDNSNILKCAAQCLANSLRLISESELPDSYKRSLITPWWDTYFDLKIHQQGKYSDYADFLLKMMVTEVNGDIIQGAFRRGVSFHLLGGIVSGLTHVDEVLVDRKTYDERLADMKELIQVNVLPVLRHASPVNKTSILGQTLGSEFRLVNDTISVSNRFGSWTELIHLT